MRTAGGDSINTHASGSCRGIVHAQVELHFIRKQPIGDPRLSPHRSEHAEHSSTKRDKLSGNVGPATSRLQRAATLWSEEEDGLCRPTNRAPIAVRSFWTGTTSGTMRQRGRLFTGGRRPWIARCVGGRYFGLSLGLSRHRRRMPNSPSISARQPWPLSGCQYGKRLM